MSQPAEAPFQRHLQERMAETLREIPAATAAEVNALSVWIYTEEDEPPQFVADLSYNTETQFARMTDEAADANEARWNFAFWLQNPSMMIGSSEDETGRAARQQWLEETGFADELAAAEDEDRELEICDDIESAFCEVVAAACRQLHASGLITELFGRPIPIILHDLEYHEGTVDLTSAANPPDVIQPFVEWVESLSDF